MKTRKLRSKLRRIIFKSDTTAGRWFDLGLLMAILISVIAVMADSIPEINSRYHQQLAILEWTVTIIFSVEYLLRIWTIGRPVKYILSFYGLIDLLAIIPTYLSLFLAGSQYLIIIRILRILRIFRILKLGRYIAASSVLVIAMKESRHKIIVFLEVILTIVVVMGALIYLIEGPENGFTSIPLSIYWAIVTITTVGYGDISPATPLGQALASLIMILGYAIIAVPTGIISVEMARVEEKRRHSAAGSRKCPSCGEMDHEKEASYCKRCGYHLNDDRNVPGNPLYG